MNLVSRKQASAKGLKRYFTGKPCKRGHVAERIVSTMTCVSCKNERERELYRRDPAAASARAKDWQERNRERHNRRAVQYQMARVKADPIYAAKHSVRVLIGMALRRKGFGKRSRTQEILGCTWAEFIRQIERQFLPGMSWENRGEWHLDHITPLATARSEADVVALNHVSNLRPVWAAENMAKKDKILFLI